MIHHIWFDFSETIAFLKKERHRRLRYESYAEVVKKPVNNELIAEYEALYKNHDKSNSAVFRSLGLPASYWSDRVNSVDPSELYQLADSRIPEMLKTIRTIVPISLFSNIHLGNVLPALGIDAGLFTHIISAGMVKEPKPALEGFYKIIELTKLPPDEILYIGDHVAKDVRPAKQAGIQAALVWSTSNEADYSFGTFDDIVAFVKKMAKKGNAIDERRLNIVNEDGTIVGVATREEIHRKGLLHREIHVWFYTLHGEVIFQHRAKDKDTYPDLLDSTVGGHVEIGSDYESTALKEMQEETGVKAKKDDLTLIQEAKSKSYDKATGTTNNCIRLIYAYRYDGKLEDLKIEVGKALGFEVWPLERIFNLSKEDKQHLIPILYQKESIAIFRKIQQLTQP